MEHDNQLVAQADSLAELLTSGSLDDATTAQLRGWIEKAASRLLEVETQLEELQLLRSEVIARIGGMAKAVAVARDSESQLCDAAELINSLENSSASQLIDIWRKVSARFRDTFRGSFGPIGHPRAGGQSHGRDYSDFK